MSAYGDRLASSTLETTDYPRAVSGLKTKGLMPGFLWLQAVPLLAGFLSPLASGPAEEVPAQRQRDPRERVAGLLLRARVAAVLDCYLAPLPPGGVDGYRSC